MFNKFIGASVGLSIAVTPFLCLAQSGSAATSEGIAIPAFTTSAASATSLKQGDSGDLVKDLQSILKSDPSIYPSGIITGYYGPLTADAVRRLQAKYGLPQTGELDPATKAVIFPDTQIELSVISPNGGETWKVGETHKIEWKATFGPTPEPVDTNGPVSGRDAQYPPQPSPFFPRASLDLIRDSVASFDVHIGTVDLYGSTKVWSIPASVPQGKDYRIKISINGNVPCLYRSETSSGSVACPMADTNMMYPYPGYGTSDTSDDTFSITGGSSSAPDLNAIRQQLAALEAQLTSALAEIHALQATIGKIDAGTQSMPSTAPAM